MRNVEIISYRMWRELTIKIKLYAVTVSQFKRMFYSVVRIRNIRQKYYWCNILKISFILLVHLNLIAYLEDHS